MAEFRGNLYIFVDVPREEDAASAARGSGGIFGDCAPGAMGWYLTGWAIGRNARGSYCARTSVTKLRAFDTFASAMEFARQKRKTRPHERFHLVHDLDGRKCIVTSLEQIKQREGDNVRDTHLAPADAESPSELDILTAQVGRIVATNALVLLKTLTQHGEEAARACFSNATYDRLWRVLCDAGLVDGSLADNAA